MKLYTSMREDENMSWCKPYVSEDGKVISVNEGAIASSIGIIDAESRDVSEIIETENLIETGCPNCPFRNECDAMHVDMTGWYRVDLNGKTDWYPSFEDVCLAFDHPEAENVEELNTFISWDRDIPYRDYVSLV